MKKFVLMLDELNLWRSDYNFLCIPSALFLSSIYQTSSCVVDLFRSIFWISLLVTHKNWLKKVSSPFSPSFYSCYSFVFVCLAAKWRHFRVKDTLHIFFLLIRYIYIYIYQNIGFIKILSQIRHTFFPLVTSSWRFWV